MPEPFDPYYKWLGIPPEQQPVNYYRLLGIALYEESEPVIDNAADRQMVFIRTFQAGEHSKESQKLLNELSQARVVLLNKAKKQEYDNKLKQEIAQKQSALKPPVATPVTPSVASRSEGRKSHLFDFSFASLTSDKNKEKSKKKSGKRAKSTNNTPVDPATPIAVNRNRIIIASAIAGVIVLLGLIGLRFAFNSGSSLEGSAGFFQTGKIPQPGQRRVENIDGIEYAFRWCPQGSFIMGTEGNEGREKSKNPCLVTISRGFWILENEVTLGMFKSFSSQTGYKSQGVAPYVLKSNNWQSDAQFSWEKTPYPQTDNHPVTCISWLDAQAFCKWISSKVHQDASLPSEAQWEYACRAGSKKHIAGTGKIDEMGRYSSNTKNVGAFPIRSLKPNDWGIYDMHGNVWEYCQDVYTGDLSKITTEKAIPGHENATHARRGGSWFNPESYCRATTRMLATHKIRASDIGFRFVLLDDSIPLIQPEKKDAPEKSAEQSKEKPVSSALSAHNPGDKWVKDVHNVQFVFRWCPPGTFSMGSKRTNMPVDEALHDVTFTQGFWMLESEVTIGMFRAFIADSGYSPTGDPIRVYKSSKKDRRYWEIDSQASWAQPEYPVKDTFPVSCVSWDDAQAFCQWLSKQINEDVKLPTESQWEYASRAGSMCFYAGFDNLNRVGWYNENSGFRSHPVKKKKPNAWSIYDTSGNVGEWVQDLAGNYPRESVIDPVGPTTGNLRIHRGGSWQQPDKVCRCANRVFSSPRSRYSDLGFRVSITPKKP